MRGSSAALLLLLAAAGAAAEDPAVKLLRSFGQETALAGERTLRTMVRVASELGLEDAEDAKTNATCSVGDVPAAICTSSAQQAESMTMGHLAGEAASTLRQMLDANIRVIEELAEDDALSEIDLDVEQPVVDSSHCGKVQHLDIENDPRFQCTSACTSELRGVLAAAEGLAIAQVVEGLSGPLARAPRLAALLESSHNLKIVDFAGVAASGATQAYDANKSLLKHLFGEQGAEKELLWVYFATENPEPVFIGYKVDKGEAHGSSRSGRLYTYGDSSGMQFWTTHSDGRPAKLSKTDTTWSLKSREWYETGTTEGFSWGWSGLYKFSPPEVNEVGMSLLRQIDLDGRRAVIGVDFYLNGLMSDVMDDLQLDSKAVLFLIAPNGDLVASNRVTSQGGDLQRATEIRSFPEIAQAAAKLIAEFPSILAPVARDVEFEELTRVKALEIRTSVNKKDERGRTEHVTTDWSVELTTTNRIRELLAGSRAHRLDWTIVHMLPTSSYPEPIKSTTRDCFTNVGCKAAASGAVMDWRVNQINALHGAIRHRFSYGKEAVNYIFLDEKTKPGSILHSNYVYEKLRDLEMITYIHIADYAAMKLVAYQRKPDGSITYLKCKDEKCFSAVEYLVVPGGEDTPVDGDSLQVDWGFLRSVQGDSRVRPLMKAYNYIPKKSWGQSWGLQRRSTKLVINVGIDHHVVRDVLQGHVAATDTTVYIVDTGLRLIVATKQSQRAHYIKVTNTLVDPAIRTTALAISSRDRIRVSDKFVHTKHVGEYYADYRRYIDPDIKNWFLVVVRHKFESAYEEFGEPTLNEDGTCIDCSNSLISLSTRDQVLMDVVDTWSDHVDTARRSVLLTHGYIRAGLLAFDAGNSKFRAALQSAVKNTPSLLWAAAVVGKDTYVGFARGADGKVAELKGTEAFGLRWQNQGRHTVAEQHKMGTHFADMWAWAAPEKINGALVLNAVRPVFDAATGDVLGVLVAGVDSSEATQAAISAGSGYDVIIATPSGLMSDANMPNRVDALACVGAFLDGNPSYRMSGSEVYMQDFFESSSIVTKEHGRLTAAALAHFSPTWRHNPQPAVGSLGIVIVRTPVESYCLGTTACEANLAPQLKFYRKKLVLGIKEELEADAERLQDCLQLEDSALLEKPFAKQQSHVADVRQIMVYHLALYPEANYIVLHPKGSTTQFMAVYRLTSLSDVDKRADVFTFKQFGLYECFGDGGDASCALHLVQPDARATAAPESMQAPNIQFEAWNIRSNTLSKTVLVVAGRDVAGVSARLDEMDVTAETLIYLVSKDNRHESTVIANKMQGVYGHELTKSIQHLPDDSPTEIKTLPRVSLPSLSGKISEFDISYVTHEQWLLVVVEPFVAAQSHEKKVQIDLEEDPTCSELGYCESKVDVLREADYSAKARFIFEKTLRVLELAEATAARIAAAASAPLAFGAFSRADPLVAVINQQLLKGVVSAVLYTDGTSAMQVDESNIRWRNATGLFLMQNEDGAEMEITGATWEPKSDGEELRWVLESDAMVLSQMIPQGATAATLTVTLGQDLLAKTVLNPFEGILMSRNGTKIVSNTRCQTAANLLYTDSELLEQILADKTVTTLGECSVDLKEFKIEGDVTLVVGSLEADVHENDYPTVSADLGCVTWSACRSALELAEMKVMDVVVTHVLGELGYAKLELTSIGANDALRAHLDASHYLTWIADLSNGGFEGVFRGPEKGTYLTMTCRGEGCEEVGVWEEGDDTVTAEPVEHFERPEFKEGELTFTPHAVYYKKGNLAAAVHLSALISDTASSLCNLEFVAPDSALEASLRPNVVIHSYADPADESTDSNVAYAEAGDGLIIRASHSAAFLPETPEIPCVVSCKQDVELFNGLQLAAATTAFATQEMVDRYSVQLKEILYDIESDGTWKEHMRNNPMLLCKYDTVSKSDVGVGWFDGLNFYQCTTDGEGKWYVKGEKGESGYQSKKYNANHGVVPDWDEQQVVVWVEDVVTAVGEMWLVRDTSDDFGHVAIRVSHNLLDTTGVSTPGFTFAVKRDGLTVLGSIDDEDESLDTYEVIISVPEIASEHAMWTVGAASARTEQEPPTDLGCFPKQACECQKDAIAGRYEKLMREALGKVGTSAKEFVGFLTDRLNALSPEPDILKALTCSDARFIISANSLMMTYTAYLRVAPPEKTTAGEADKIVRISCQAEGGCTVQQVDEDGTLSEAQPTVDYPQYSEVAVLFADDDTVIRGLLGGYALMKTTRMLSTRSLTVGMDLSRVETGLVLLLKEGVPSGTELFVYDKLAGEVALSAAEKAGLPDPTAGLITVQCGRSIGAAKNGEEAQCGFDDQAFSLLAVPLEAEGELSLVASIPKPSAVPGEGSAVFQAVGKRLSSDFEMLATDLDNRIAGSVYLLTSKARSLRISRGGGSLVVEEPTPDLTGLLAAWTQYANEKELAAASSSPPSGDADSPSAATTPAPGHQNDLGKLATTEAKKWWIQRSDHMPPAASRPPGLTAAIPVYRGGVVVCFIAVDIPFGEAFNNKLAEAEQVRHPPSTARYDVIVLSNKAEVIASTVKAKDGTRSTNIIAGKLAKSPDAQLAVMDGVGAITRGYNGTLTTVSALFQYPTADMLDDSVVANASGMSWETPTKQAGVEVMHAVHVSLVVVKSPVGGGAPAAEGECLTAEVCNNAISDRLTEAVLAANGGVSQLVDTSLKACEQMVASLSRQYYDQDHDRVETTFDIAARHGMYSGHCDGLDVEQNIFPQPVAARTWSVAGDLSNRVLMLTQVNPKWTITAFVDVSRIKLLMRSVKTEALASFVVNAGSDGHPLMMTDDQFFLIAPDSNDRLAAMISVMEENNFRASDSSLGKTPDKFVVGWKRIAQDQPFFVVTAWAPFQVPTVSIDTGLASWMPRVQGYLEANKNDLYAVFLISKGNVLGYNADGLVVGDANGLTIYKGSDPEIKSSWTIDKESCVQGWSSQRSKVLHGEVGLVYGARTSFGLACAAKTAAKVSADFLKHVYSPGLSVIAADGSPVVASPPRDMANAVISGAAPSAEALSQVLRGNALLGADVSLQYNAKLGSYVSSAHRFDPYLIGHTNVSSVVGDIAVLTDTSLVLAGKLEATMDTEDALAAMDDMQTMLQRHVPLAMGDRRVLQDLHKLVFTRLSTVFSRSVDYAGVFLPFTGSDVREAERYYFSGYIRASLVTTTGAPDSYRYLSCEAEIGVEFDSLQNSCAEPATWAVDAAGGVVDAKAGLPVEGGYFGMPQVEKDSYHMGPRVRGVQLQRRAEFLAKNWVLASGFVLGSPARNELFLLKVVARGQNDILSSRSMPTDAEPDFVKLIEADFPDTRSEKDEDADSPSFVPSTPDNSTVLVRGFDATRRVTYAKLPGSLVILKLTEIPRSDVEVLRIWLNLPIGEYGELNGDDNALLRELRATVSSGDPDVLKMVDLEVEAEPVEDVTRVSVRATTLEGWGARFSDIAAAVSGVALTAQWRQLPGPPDFVKPDETPAPVSGAPATASPGSNPEPTPSDEADGRAGTVLVVILVVAFVIGILWVLFAKLSKNQALSYTRPTALDGDSDDEFPGAETNDGEFRDHEMAETRDSTDEEQEQPKASTHITI
ncbi:hypothetical protein DIPPA_23808 [Diplonema papillatum]|nr:hypothetical protein DIPPA_23808 [Diplonema papillatum]